jgi:hypothetical protein
MRQTLSLTLKNRKWHIIWEQDAEENIWT